MLRWLVVLLVVANLGFYAWTRGFLDNVVGVRAMGDREPDRLARQVRPERVRIVPPRAAGGGAAAATTAPASAACLESGPYTQAEVAAAEATAAELLPPGSWTSLKLDQPGAAAHMLRVERADPELATRLQTLRTGGLSKGFALCARL
jgi:hypothetical protein